MLLLFGSVLFVFITKFCMHITLINVHAYISSNARDSNFKLSHHLHPYFVYANRKCSDESVQMHRSHTADHTLHISLINVHAYISSNKGYFQSSGDTYHSIVFLFEEDLIPLLVLLKCRPDLKLFYHFHSMSWVIFELY